MPFKTICADSHIYKLKELLPAEIHVITYENQPEINDLKKSEILLIRTVTRIDNTFLEQIPETIRVIGTASAGIDHVDTDLLIQKSIPFFSAAGCNSLAVAEYVQTGLFYFAIKTNYDLTAKTIAIIGVGHVGSRVSELCKKMGMNVVEYDPPRMKRDATFVSADFSEVLNADILTFHVPYQPDTHHYFSDKLFGNQSYDLVINAARGGIVDELFLLNLLKNGLVKETIIDCWENEPDFNQNLRDIALLATPHIAGYSQQAKLKATTLLLEQLFAYFENTYSCEEKSFFSISNYDTALIPENALIALQTLHNAFDYDKRFRNIEQSDVKEKKRQFSALRNALTFRNEFRFHKIPTTWKQHFPQLSILWQTL